MNSFVIFVPLVVKDRFVVIVRFAVKPPLSAARPSWSVADRASGSERSDGS